MTKYNVAPRRISTILTWIRDGEIAIPEIQRPFVWERARVRDLIDSLYQGFPVGYLVLWRNPDVRLKDGSISRGKQILIDGQQRVTALQAAVVGNSVIDVNYKSVRIKIAFNPLTQKFEVNNAALEKDSAWIPDISEVYKTSFNDFDFVTTYCAKNGLDATHYNEVNRIVSRLKQIQENDIGVIDLASDLSIEEVTDIFIRLNSSGVVLSQADFVMSKISADEAYGGNKTRKIVDYFCHCMMKPEDWSIIQTNDTSFGAMPEAQKIAWVAREQQDIYLPTCADVLRVAFTYKFRRGKFSDLVSLLSGRDFETRNNVAEIAKKSFEELNAAVMGFVSETNFKRFLMIIHSAGVVSADMIRSQNALNFAYALYLYLRDRGTNQAETERIVRKWFVLSVLTRRYSGSPETQIEFDIKRFAESENPRDYLEQEERAKLSDAFWDVELVDRLDTAVSSSPYFHAFQMAQVVLQSRGFLSEQIRVGSLLEQRGDIHHIFPKKYLCKNGITNRGQYNQIANYAYTQSEVNIAISDDAPCIYMSRVKKQCQTNQPTICGICDGGDLAANLAENCIPENIFTMDVTSYQEFLKERRILMAKFMRRFYQTLS